MKKHRSRLENAQGFGVVWEIVKDTVKTSLGERRVGRLLFLDDLRLRLEANYPLGTNNVVLNHVHISIVEVAKIYASGKRFCLYPDAPRISSSFGAPE